MIAGRLRAAGWPLLFGVAAIVVSACHRDQSPDTAAPPASSEKPSTAVYTPPPSSVHWPPASASASAPPVASSAPVAVASAAPSASLSAPEAAPKPAHVVDPQNKKKPELASEDLTARGRRLFDAIKADDPKLAADVFFPREPFLPLKDIAKPGKYWDQLFRIYENDIHEIHRKRARDLEGAEFESFELGSTPGWVKPGEEANKIGYYPTLNAKLRFKNAKGKTQTIEAKTIISWDEAWFITHLLPIKK
jgi:hypothetical protein